MTHTPNVDEDYETVLFTKDGKEIIYAEYDENYFWNTKHNYWIMNVSAGDQSKRPLSSGEFSAIWSERETAK